jgi:hypothetical protein
MISHKHKCVFTHVPKTAGKAVLAAFGLPLRKHDFRGDRHFDRVYGHHPLRAHTGHPTHDYFKFAFVRNPWDRVVSAFFYLDGGGCNEFDEAYRAQYLARYNGSFEAFVRGLPSHVTHVHFRPQTYWLSDATGRLLPDFIGRFETIEPDFRQVADRLGLSADLPVVNRSRHRPYREHYSAETRDIVASIYRRDIDAFSYQF